MKDFKKVLIANRGEIAVRVIRTLREMNIGSVAVYSEADRSCLHVAEADEAICIGASPARESYLNMKAIVTAAKMTGADAVHPGYGFLSENPEFSRMISEAGMVFIGPSPKAIEMLGYKSTARALASSHNVPITPGTKTCVLEKDCKKEAAAIGYPIMIKAAAGGGGKGMRIVNDASALEHELHMAKSESKAAFGDDGVYFEKYVASPRHVEIQIAADSQGNVVAFPERDCSVQRRHQKLIEESPSPAVDSKLREKMAESAVRLVKASGYTGVGTVEFLLEPGGDFYFMEVNTRLQVEHPVTEAVSGLDLVREQLVIAAGGKISVDQARALKVNGHSIEHRINAEDPDHNFAPNCGILEEWLQPGGPGVRVDSHMYSGYTIPSYYDSLLAKLIVWAPNRERAIARSKRALGEFRVKGIKTTIPFHLRVLGNEEFVSGKFDTGLIARMSDPALKK